MRHENRNQHRDEPSATEATDAGKEDKRGGRQLWDGARRQRSDYKFSMR